MLDSNISAQDISNEQVRTSPARIGVHKTLKFRPSDEHRVQQDVTFSIEQTVACLLTDFIDPFVSTFLQKRWGNKDKKAASLEENVKGEIVGDLGGAVAFVGIRTLLRTPLDALVRGVDAVAHPTLQKLGHAHLAGWAKQHGVDTHGASYQEALDNFTHYQAQTWVDSALLATSSSAINVLSQKHLFGNQQSYATIASSKLVGVALTMGSILGMRATLPDTSSALDKELNEKYVTPITNVITNQENTHKKQWSGEHLTPSQNDGQTKWAYKVQQKQLDGNGAMPILT